MSDHLLLMALVPLVAILIVLFTAILLKRRRGPAEVAGPLQNLALTIQQEHAQMAVLTEKLARLEQVMQPVSNIQVELRGLSERASKVEQSQDHVNRGVAGLGAGLAETSAIARGLVEATRAIREDLSRAKTDLTELNSHSRARHELELRTADSVRRMESIIAGTHTRGLAGENILELVFAKLPADWQVRNLKVGDKVVEFGLRLPNNLVLPIDSKWTGTHLLEQFLHSDNPLEQRRLKSQIGETVIARAMEVRKYIDPNITPGFGLAAIPDAVYDLCPGIQADIFELNVVLVSYSMFLPYLLLVFQTVCKTSQSLDLQKLDGYLAVIQDSARVLQDEIEGRISRALTMLGNSRDDMRANVARISSGLRNMRLNGHGQLTGEDD